jgi:hypothetical protein
MKPVQVICQIFDLCGFIALNSTTNMRGKINSTNMLEYTASISSDFEDVEDYLVPARRWSGFFFELVSAQDNINIDSIIAMMSAIVGTLRLLCCATAAADQVHTASNYKIYLHVIRRRELERRLRMFLSISEQIQRKKYDAKSVGYNLNQ